MSPRRRREPADEPITLASPFAGPPRFETSAEARAFLLANMRTGTHCPTCEQPVKIYKRKLYASMSRVLWMISRHTHGDEWIHVPSLIADLPYSGRVRAAIRGDWTKLVFWGFLEKKGDVREDGSLRTGKYRITPAGRTFVAGLSTAPSHIYTYNDKLLGVSTRFVTFRETFGVKFSYAELMQEAS